MHSHAHLRRIINFFDNFGPTHPATRHILAYGLGEMLEAARAELKMQTRPFGKLWPPPPEKKPDDPCY